MVIYYVTGFAVKWAGFATANSVSPIYIATEISDFVPRETKDIWKEKFLLSVFRTPSEVPEL